MDDYKDVTNEKDDTEIVIQTARKRVISFGTIVFVKIFIKTRITKKVNFLDMNEFSPELKRFSPVSNKLFENSCLSSLG